MKVEFRLWGIWWWGMRIFSRDLRIFRAKNLSEITILGPKFRQLSGDGLNVLVALCAVGSLSKIRLICIICPWFLVIFRNFPSQIASIQRFLVTIFGAKIVKSLKIIYIWWGGCWVVCKPTIMSNPTQSSLVEVVFRLELSWVCDNYIHLVFSIIVFIQFLCIKTQGLG